MQVDVVEVAQSQKSHILAVAAVEITFDPEHKIKISDLRVLRNGQGELWIGMPSRAVTSNSVRRYDYVPIVVCSPKLKRQIEDAVFAAFERFSAGGAQ